MKNLRKYAAIGAVALTTILPFAASAHNKDDNKKEDRQSEIRTQFNEHFENDEHRAFTGKVTAVNTTGFTLTDANGTVYTVTTANAQMRHPFERSIVLADLKVNDKVVVKGTLTGTTIVAKTVLDMPANTHRAKTKGLITAVSGNTITVQNTHDGIVSNVTIKTDANTQFTKDGQVATLADAKVGTKISVKGLWDETLNILNAIRINIKTIMNK
ncbi:MAG: DUF5666 domain-containing protein [Patescibacteria group bacterium]